jgi:hypothetical protein
MKDFFWGVGNTLKKKCYRCGRRLRRGAKKCPETGQKKKEYCQVCFGIIRARWF